MRASFPTPIWIFRMWWTEIYIRIRGLNLTMNKNTSFIWMPLIDNLSSKQTTKKSLAFRNLFLEPKSCVFVSEVCSQQVSWQMRLEIGSGSEWIKIGEGGPGPSEKSGLFTGLTVVSKCQLGQHLWQGLGLELIGHLIFLLVNGYCNQLGHKIHSDILKPT